jgi:hypothetical protein
MRTPIIIGLLAATSLATAVTYIAVSQRHGASSSAAIVHLRTAASAAQEVAYAQHGTFIDREEIRSALPSPKEVAAVNPDAVGNGEGEEEVRPAIVLTTGYESSYLFRGMGYGGHLMEATVAIPWQISERLAFTFAPWYGVLGDGTGYDELDLAASLAFDTGVGTLTAGATWYYYPFLRYDDFEPFVSFSNSIGNLTWTLATYRDAKADGGNMYTQTGGNGGYYYEAATEYAIEVTDRFTLTPSARLGYGSRYYGVNGFNNVLLKLNASFAMTDSFTIAPFIAASLALPGLVDAGYGDYLVGGAMLSYSF